MKLEDEVRRMNVTKEENFWAKIIKLHNKSGAKSNNLENKSDDARGDAKSKNSL